MIETVSLVVYFAATARFADLLWAN